MRFNSMLDNPSCTVIVVIWFCTEESQILYGIRPEWPSAGKATVRGMLCDQESRDRFRVSFSKTTSQQITPPITSGTITIRFWPVIEKESGEPVDDLFVIGMRVVAATTQRINAGFFFGKGVDLTGLLGGHKKLESGGLSAGSRGGAPVEGLGDEAESFL